MRILSFLSWAFVIPFFFTLGPSCKKNEGSGFQPAPTISAFSLTHDTIGARVMLTGTNFGVSPADNIVKFNGVLSEVVFVTGTTNIACVVPVGATNGRISVTVNGQTATSADSFFVAQPVITGFFPTQGGIGYPLFISGSGFSTDPGSNLVTINGAKAKVLTATATQLKLTIPLSASTGKIVVQVKGLTATSASDIIIKRMVVSSLAGSGTMGFADGAGTEAMLAGLGIASAGNGNFYFADATNNRIRKVTSAGVVTTIAGTGVKGNDDGPAATATFNNPTWLAVDSHGNIFVSNSGSNNIREISTDGIVSTFAGDPSGSSGIADDTGTAARFYNPMGIAVDKNDNVLVMDYQNNKLRKITTAGVVSTIAGSGLDQSTDGTGTTAAFKEAFGLAIDPAGNMYTCEPITNKIRKITPSGLVTTFAGKGTTGTLDGPLLSASFNFPVGIVSDQSGNLYVTDEYNGMIRMITTDGMVTTVAGNGSIDSKDNTGYYASFAMPVGIAFDPSGMLAVIDVGGIHKIRKIDIQ